MNDKPIDDTIVTEKYDKSVELDSALGTNPGEHQCHHNPSVSCSDCRLGDLCLPIALNTSEITQLDTIVQRGKPLQTGQELFHDGDPFTAIYAVRSGSLKSYSLFENGSEQVTGFYLPGEIVGMDGISSMAHTVSVVALETASVCEIPFKMFSELSLKIPSLQNRFFRIMGEEITKDQKIRTLLSSNTAEQRVISLLLSLSHRHHQRQLSASKFRLPMTRADMGSFLGLTVETVSRSLSKLQKQGFIALNHREVEIIDAGALKEIIEMKPSR